MNLIVLDVEEVGDDGQVRLEGRRAEHVREVLGAEVGRTLRVGVVGSGLGTGEVTSVAGGAVVMTLHISEPPEPLPSIDLVMALPRPPTLKKVLSQAAAMGVGRVDLIRANRVEKSYFQSPLLEPARVREELLLGLEQGRAVRMPTVEVHPLFMPFCNEVLPRRLGLLSGADTLGLLAHVDAPVDVTALPFRGDGSQRVVLAIGPEGGWTDHEIQTLTGAGFTQVWLGPRPLRVETAVVAAMAQISLLLGPGRRRPG